MNKSILIKGSIIMGLFLLIIGAAVGCSLITKDATEPTLTNGDSVYFSTDDFSATNSEVWEMMKNVDGLSFLTEYVDRLLLADEISKVTQTDIDNEVLYLTYNTRSEGIIAEIQADPEVDQVYIDDFEQSLIVLGFDPDNADDLRTFTELSIAKAKIARAYTLAATEDDKYALSIDDVQSYYESVTFGDVCAIELRFNSAAEAKLVFEKFDLVSNFNRGIGFYHDPLVDIEDVASDGFVLDVNTTQLTDAEVFTKFVAIYNYINPWATQITEDNDTIAYCDNVLNDAVYNFNEMTLDRDASEPNVALATYLFQTLSVDVLDLDGINYSYTAQPFGDSYSYVYKITEEATTDFEDLTSAELLDVKNEILDLIIVGENVENIIDEVYKDAKLEIYDPYIALQYEFQNGVKFDNNGSKTVVAVLDDEEITADELFTFMEERVGISYAVELYKINTLLTSDAYADKFGDDYDYLNSDNDELALLRDELRAMKTRFASNGYATYNLSSQDFSWTEFLYLAFNVKTEAEVIQNVYIMQDLQNKIIFPSLNYDNSAGFIQKQFDEYFSLNAQHLYIYLDFDNDFIADDLDEYVAGLDAAELTEFNAVKLAFDTLLFDRIDSDVTFANIVKEFENSLIDDPANEWAAIKQYGFEIRTDNLSKADEDGQITSLSNNNIENLDPVFASRLKTIYGLFVNLDKDTTGGVENYMDTQIVQSSVGIHIISATKGSGFVKYSAKYDPTVDTTVTYTVGSANTEDMPNESQIDIYNKIVFATIGGDATLDLLPPDVYQSINQLYSPIFQAHFTAGGFSVLTLNTMLDNNVHFTNDDANTLAALTRMLDVLTTTTFTEDYGVID